MQVQALTICLLALTVCCTAHISRKWSHLNLEREQVQDAMAMAAEREPVRRVTEDPDPRCTPGEDSSCPPGFFCTFLGHCLCEDVVYSYFDYHYPTTCFRKAGTTCVHNPSLPEFANQRCVMNALCVAINFTHGRCECQPGHIVSKHGFCHGDFGTACDEQESSYNDMVGCSRRSMLECRDGRCVCGSPVHVYEDTERGCVAPAGEPCGIWYHIDGKYVDSNVPHDVQCASGLNCVQRDGGLQICE